MNIVIRKGNFIIGRKRYNLEIVKIKIKLARQETMNNTFVVPRNAAVPTGKFCKLTPATVFFFSGQSLNQLNF